MHLRKLNCTSHRAENGKGAIEMLRSTPAPNMYNLILMDLRMPVMDGFEATTMIKGSNACNIPIVALTRETSKENRQRCNEIEFEETAA
jgi:two-component system sensor histidine kinase/response regulator